MPRKEMRGRYRSVRIVQYNVIGYKELIISAMLTYGKDRIENSTILNLRQRGE